MRRRRSSARSRTSASGRLLLLLVAALTGAWFAPWLSQRTSGRTPLNPDRYTLLVPGASASDADFAERAWSGLADGELVLQARGVGLAERLILDAPALRELELRFAQGSGPLGFTGRTVDGGPTTLATLSEVGFESPRTGARPWTTPGVARIEFREGAAFAEGVALGASTPYADLGPAGTARLRGLTLRGADGAVLLDDTFVASPPVAHRLAWALACVALAAALHAAFTRRGATAFGRGLLALACALPLLVLLTRYGEWAALLERARLAGVDVGTVRRVALAASLLPVAAGVLLLTNALDATVDRPAPPAAVRWGVRAALVLAATRSFDGWGVTLALAGVAATLVPWRVGQAAQLPPGSVWWRDLPAGVVAAALGWGPGLALALAWRALQIVQDAPILLRRGAAKAGVDGLVVVALLVPVAAEGLARIGPLKAAWSAGSLAGASIGASTSASALTPFADERCGEGEPAVVASFGGSSTGGAWQFRGRTDAFFPAQLHRLLCAGGLSVRSLNYGDSGRDSFDVALAAPATFAAVRPRVVILYLGVNDLLTVDSPLTRRQRHEQLEARSAGAGALADFASRSRLLTASALLLRGADPRPLVQSVPLADAEVNLRTILVAAKENGARVLLVPELATATFASTLRPYADMMERVGLENPHAAFLDLEVQRVPGAVPVLADRNHLSPEGAAELAERLFPEVRAWLAAP